MTDPDRALYRAASRLMLLARDIAEMALDGQAVPGRVRDETRAAWATVAGLLPGEDAGTDIAELLAPVLPEAGA